MFTCISVNANWKSGTDYAQGVLEYKKSENGMSDIDYNKIFNFMGYTIGIVDALDNKHFCIPQNSIQGQLNSIIVKYIEAHPDLWHHAAIDLVIWPLKEAFPCSSSTQDQERVQETIEREVNILIKEYPGFDLLKISNKLKEIKKGDQAKANKLNNPQGWELLHLKYFNKQ